jgi:hypothetical protein
MERGLIWLPLLAMFIWLTWTGWNEYQKVEAYRLWSEDFDKAKYDIYAVLGQKGEFVTWGKPTRKGMIQLQTFSLKDVQEIRLLVNNNPVQLDQLPNKGRVSLEFRFNNSENSIQIAFTEIELAAKWTNYLQKLGVRN